MPLDRCQARARVGVSSDSQPLAAGTAAHTRPAIIYFSPREAPYYVYKNHDLPLAGSFDSLRTRHALNGPRT